MNDIAGNQKEISILLIEDDFDHAELTKRILSTLNKNIKLIHVKSGEKALDYLVVKCSSQNNIQPDLVLLDIRLPGLDGIEILKRIKATPKVCEVPVVILSTSGFNPDRELSKKYKADYYLVKPLEISVFSNILKELGII